MSTPPGRPGENDSEMSLEQKLRPRGLAEWTAVLAAVALGVSVPSRLFDATVLFTYHPSAMALSFGALMPLGVYVALKTRALGAGPLRLRAMWTHAALQTLQLPGKVWALALHSHLLVAGGALCGAPLADGTGVTGGQIRVRLFGLADLASGRGHAVAVRTLQTPSIAPEWGVRTVATHGGTVVVAGGDDGVVHVWALAEKGKDHRGDADGHGTD